MKQELRRPLRAALEWIDGRSLRERIALLAGALALAVAGWTVLLMDPLSARITAADSEAQQVEEQLRGLEARGQEILEAHVRDDNVRLRTRATELRQQIESVDAGIHEHTVTMIPPAEMAYFLEEVLAGDTALRLERLENVGAEPLLDPSAEGAEGEAKGAWTGVYKHSFEVVVRGPYLDTIRYLRALEALPWNFFWEMLDYQVLEHPDGRATIRAYTLSSGEDWIGA